MNNEIVKVNKEINTIIIEIKKIVEQNGKCIVAIDGRAAAGKSTLADILKNKLNASVVHMDDFFLPLELRTEERYCTAGGNIHYERFNIEVATNLKSNVIFKYQTFNCKKMKLASWHNVQNKEVVIVEGAYSTHPKINIHYNLKIFLDIDKRQQQMRILNRNGNEMLKQFVDKWIPLEEAYFKEYKISSNCDIISKI